MAASRTTSAGRTGSQSDYAAHRGVSRQMVSKWAKGGRLVVRDGKVDFDATDASLNANLDPARGGKSRKPVTSAVGGGGGDGSSALPPAGPVPVAPDVYTRARTHREAFAAKAAEANYRRMIGELVEREEYLRGLMANLGPTVQRLRTLSSRLATRLAAETDVRRTTEMIDQEVEAVCAEIARYVATLAQDQPAAAA